ncbi:hypothetical protein Q5424_01255 [Conexibacter sp. JD483]|uniref:hypothetical protein n=1 Tax=unclassified Conexibacter TaxID=2627773 RepID=UPI00271C5565|nr:MULTISPECIES: hypothetical protein [unclassified Conexibacter]MDO8185856.1 hypothetical protein [Conexibacter sp. CPCC 205706]MDO8198600.1 hypothetical protein [Conexibacter sp. CPCC 205762]MDR9367686.1 hypothetical protein [Conexibacter sp. JD483]
MASRDRPAPRRSSENDQRPDEAGNDTRSTAPTPAGTRPKLVPFTGGQGEHSVDTWAVALIDDQDEPATLLSWGETRALAITRALDYLDEREPNTTFTALEATLVKARTRRLAPPAGGTLDRVLRTTGAAIDDGAVTRRGPNGEPYANLKSIMKRRGKRSGLDKTRTIAALEALETLGLVDHLPAGRRRSAVWRPRPATAETPITDRDQLPFDGAVAQVERRWAVMTERTSPRLLAAADVFVPHKLVDAWKAESGIVGILPTDGPEDEPVTVTIYYQEDVGGGSQFLYWADRVGHAHARMVERAPTHRTMTVLRSRLTRVGRYDPVEGVIELVADDGATVALVSEWLGITDPAQLDVQLQTHSWLSHKTRRAVRAAIAAKPESRRRRLEIIDAAQKHRCDDLIPDAWLSYEPTRRT